MNSKNDVHVFVVDDDAAVRKSLCWLLGTERIATRSYASAEAFLAAWSEDWRGCITLDVRMPGMNGLQLQHALGRLGNRLPVIIITGHADIPMAIQAMKAGAHDFIEKPYQDEELLRSIRSAIQVNLKQQGESRERKVVESRLASLTPREFEVMKLVVAGETNKRIADILDISVKTVEIHRARVMSKMGADSLPNLIRLVLGSGISL